MNLSSRLIPTTLAATLLCGSLLGAQTTHDVGTSGFSFVPASTPISLGDTVRWTMGGSFHTVTDGDGFGGPGGLFDSGILANEATFEFPYDEATVFANPRAGGVYDYHCVTHLGFNMVGDVVISDIPLVADVLEVSQATGGTQNWTLDAGPAQGGRLYLVVGSLSGTSPGFPIDGNVLPLVIDAYTILTLQLANSVNFPGSAGFLDAAGQGSAAFVVPAGAGNVGMNFNHAFLTIDVFGSGTVTFTSNPVPLALGA